MHEASQAKILQDSLLHKIDFWEFGLPKNSESKFLWKLILLRRTEEKFATIWSFLLLKVYVWNRLLL